MTTAELGVVTPDTIDGVFIALDSYRTLRENLNCGLDGIFNFCVCI